MKVVRLLLVLTLVFLVSSSPALAATASRGAIVQPKLRADRLAVVVNFSKLDNIESVTYSLTYTARGVMQGVNGSIKPTGGQSSTTRELLLGTCSRNVCTYHQNIKNLRLTVRSKLKAGSTKYVRKSFLIRI